MNLELLLKSVQIAVTNSPLILAVDDDEDNLLLLTEILKPICCSCITAIDGHTALVLAQEKQPDLILLDVMLPDLNGTAVIQRLRQNPKTSAIPIVAVTALARVEDRESLILAGCNDYISKPYMIDDLEALINHYLNLSLKSSVA
ncbi:MAG: response regulator [Chroococcidiopsidaceae cyanobacterium CP_BM_ER_R8_30]|nr:response regulator [Chroococcidiopsidaceae cyanobacterium CP_BM_ER_R8_30]